MNATKSTKNAKQQNRRQPATQKSALTLGDLIAAACETLNTSDALRVLSSRQLSRHTRRPLVLV